MHLDSLKCTCFHCFFWEFHFFKHIFSYIICFVWTFFNCFFLEFHVFKQIGFLDHLFRVASVDSTNMHLEDNRDEQKQIFFIMPCMLNVCFSPLQKVVWNKSKTKPTVNKSSKSYLWNHSYVERFGSKNCNTMTSKFKTQ